MPVKKWAIGMAVGRSGVDKAERGRSDVGMWGGDFHNQGSRPCLFFFVLFFPLRGRGAKPTSSAFSSGFLCCHGKWAKKKLNSAYYEHVHSLVVRSSRVECMTSSRVMGLDMSSGTSRRSASIRSVACHTKTP